MNVQEAQRTLHHQDISAPSCETMLADGTIVQTKGYGACNEGSYEFVTDLFTRPPLRPKDVIGSWGVLSIVQGGFFVKPDALTLEVTRSTYQDTFSEPVRHLLDLVTRQLRENETDRHGFGYQPEPALRLDDIDMQETYGHEHAWDASSSLHANGTRPEEKTGQAIPDIVEFTDWKHQHRPADGAFIGHMNITPPDERIPYRFLTIAYIDPSYYSRQPHMRIDGNPDGFLLMIADQ